MQRVGFSNAAPSQNPAGLFTRDVNIHHRGAVSFSDTGWTPEEDTASATDTILNMYSSSRPSHRPASAGDIKSAADWM